MTDRPGRQLVVCCDGTWIAPERGYPSHVGRIAQIAANRPGGAEDVVFYTRGVGTHYWIDRLPGGGTGEGLDADVKDAYNFLAHNYIPPDDGYAGDRIFLFGFSRGAYTVRSLAAMIDKVGLLRRDSVYLLGRAYRLYRGTSRRPEYEDAERRDAIEAARVHRPEVSFLGVFDTVGARGVPFFGLDRTLRFADLDLPGCVRHARHALAINEPRSVFRATLWRGVRAPAGDAGGEAGANAGEPAGGPVGGPARVKQTWFAGAHSDVGGGYDRDALLERGHLGRHTLEWMLAEARECGFAFDPALAASKVAVLAPSPSPSDGSLRDDYELHDSMGVAYWLMDKLLYLQRLLLEGDLRWHRRYILRSGAVGQHVHYSAARYFCVDRHRAAGGGQEGPELHILRHWSLRRGPRRFHFSRNVELTPLADAFGAATADAGGGGGGGAGGGGAIEIAARPPPRVGLGRRALCVLLACALVALGAAVVLGAIACARAHPAAAAAVALAAAALATPPLLTIYLSAKRLYSYRYLR